MGTVAFNLGPTSQKCLFIFSAFITCSSTIGWILVLVGRLAASLIDFQTPLRSFLALFDLRSFTRFSRLLVLVILLVRLRCFLYSSQARCALTHLSQILQILQLDQFTFLSFALNFLYSFFFILMADKLS